MLAAGDYFLEAQGRTTAVPERDPAKAAVVSLGLDEITPFDPAAKIVEYRFRGEPVGLVHKTLTEFTDELSKEGAVPGGGSVAALVGAPSASSSSMVASLTFAKVGMEDNKAGDLTAGPRRSGVEGSLKFLDWLIETPTPSRPCSLRSACPGRPMMTAL